MKSQRCFNTTANLLYEKMLVLYERLLCYHCYGLSTVLLQCDEHVVQVVMYKNGECQGVAFEDLYGGTYYPAVSLYKTATVRYQLFTVNPLTPSGATWVSIRVPGCQKITNDGLTRPGIGCFIAVPIWHHWASKG